MDNTNFNCYGHKRRYSVKVKCDNDFCEDTSHMEGPLMLCSYHNQKLPIYKNCLNYFSLYGEFAQRRYQCQQNPSLYQDCNIKKCQCPNPKLQHANFNLFKVEEAALKRNDVDSAHIRGLGSDLEVVIFFDCDTTLYNVKGCITNLGFIGVTGAMSKREAKKIFIRLINIVKQSGA